MWKLLGTGCGWDLSSSRGYLVQTPALFVVPLVCTSKSGIKVFWSW